MKRKIICGIAASVLALSLTACGEVSTTTLEVPSNNNIEISYVAEFYDNYGEKWMSTEGTSFNISPNKVKEYSYDSNGSWISQWTTSSVMSIEIDGHNIESCGSTIIFYDTRLEKIETEIPQDITLSTGNSYSVSTPNDLRFSDYWTLQYWWDSAQQSNSAIKSRAVIIQSQNGDPICMFQGDKVSWEVSRNLPKTTEIFIDGMPVYIHRANFAIVDLTILED